MNVNILKLTTCSLQVQFIFNTGEQDTTDLASICEEVKNIYCIHPRAHLHTKCMSCINIKMEGSCSPPVAQRTTAASGRQPMVLFFGSGLCVLLAILTNYFFSDITSPDNAETPPASSRTAHHSKNRHKKLFSQSDELMTAPKTDLQ